MGWGSLQTKHGVHCNMYTVHLALIINIHRLFYIDLWRRFQYFKSHWKHAYFLRNEFPNHLDHLKFTLISPKEKKNMIKTGLVFSFSFYFFLPFLPHVPIRLSLDGVWPPVESEISELISKLSLSAKYIHESMLWTSIYKELNIAK